MKQLLITTEKDNYRKPQLSEMHRNLIVVPCLKRYIYNTTPAHKAQEKHGKGDRRTRKSALRVCLLEMTRKFHYHTSATQMPK